MNRVSIINDGLGCTVQEIDELAEAARTAYYVERCANDCTYEDWRPVVRAVLRKQREHALERLARDLQDPDSAASKLREELQELGCPYCGKRLEEGA